MEFPEKRVANEFTHKPIMTMFTSYRRKKTQNNNQKRRTKAKLTYDVHMIGRSSKTTAIKSLLTKVHVRQCGARPANF